MGTLQKQKKTRGHVQANQKKKATWIKGDTKEEKYIDARAAGQQKGMEKGLRKAKTKNTRLSAET